jgi:hypothetical protein
MHAQLKKTLWPGLVVIGVTCAAVQMGRIVAGPLFRATDAREQSPTSGDELHSFSALEPNDTHVQAN